MLRNDIKKVYCLFEQSGRFKNIFKSLGFESYDYDIENQFNETDIICNIFYEIDKYFKNEDSIFLKFNKDDLVFAFFPCIRFSELGQLLISCNQSQLIKKDISSKCDYTIEYMTDLFTYYVKFHQLVIISQKLGFKLVLENPYSQLHFLTRYSPLKPSIIDYNRYKNGDLFEKPTQYWFYNFNPIIQFNHYLINRSDSTKKRIDNSNSRKIEMSLIANEYIKWFIQDYIFEDIDFNKEI